ncbi:timeless-domain-containing protein [Phanerochaete sordida]|uniref:Timeless-domain-containing protein n=1 Tax=Phanerochaete sordida TaxID=48140 RepID=A0A9P3LGT8_9APHY|nr:timeless-domain-containing protein [Phanerochaete sordida]
MDVDDIIDASSGDEGDYNSRRAILEPHIRSVVDALGGYEEGRYRLGDECYGCLKDLKKFWRQDDTDDERTVARIFWATRVLPNDLVPILLETAGRGMFEDKRAIAVADLMTAMTWPIDVAEELKELDEELDKGTDYTQLLQSHLYYKAALLKPGVMEALLGIVLPCLAKEAKERAERDVQIIGVILYLIRNLAFIKDLPSNMYLSADQAEFSSLQSKLIKVLSDTNMLDLLLTIASNAGEDPMFNHWNVLILEIFYLLFRGIRPDSLAEDQAKEPAKNLRRLLAAEDTLKRNFSRNASSRHSRFGTTISVTLNPKLAAKQAAAANTENAEGDAPPPPPPQASTSSQAFVLHRQQALRKDAGSMLHAGKRARAQKVKKVDELAREENLNPESRTVLQGFAKTFLESAFNPFLASLLKDIKAERPKITEKDHLRLLYITKWFLAFFLALRAADKEREWSFGLVAEVTERSWIVWVLRRMREAVEDKPKLWTELQAGVECLTALVLLIDGMGAAGGEAAHVAEVLQVQLVYNGEVLDIALDALRAYKDGTQSLAYLDASVHLAYALLRMLERVARTEGSALVRQKRRRGKKKSADGVPDEEEEPEEKEEMTETMFTFDAFEQRFANADIAQTLLVYLARYKEFPSAESMKRVVNLLHRQAVKAKAEGLFFKVSTLALFKAILDDEPALPREQPYRDLVALIHYVLRQFFKAAAADSFLVVEAFYPKNRGKWKALSSWAPPAARADPEKDTILENRWPAEVRVKKGFSAEQQLAIAVRILEEDGKREMIDWVKEILTMVIGIRQRIVEDTDGSSSQAVDLTQDDGDEDGSYPAPAKRRGPGPSKEAVEKFTDYMIPYVSDEQADAATKDPHVKLLFRLLHFAVLMDDADELEWYVPAALVPEELQRSLALINQFLEKPIDLGDKRAASLVQRKARTRRRRRLLSPTPAPSDGEDAPRRARRAKKTKETRLYKSAQFVEDSDVGEDEWAAFFAKERDLRERMRLAALQAGSEHAAMKKSGTKKRRRRGEKATEQKRKRVRGPGGGDSDAEDEDEGGGVGGDARQDEGVPRDSDVESDGEGIFNPFATPRVWSSSRTSPAESVEGPQPQKSKPKPKPRPKPRAKARAATPDVEEVLEDVGERPPPRSSSPAIEVSDGEDSDVMALPRRAAKKKPLFLSSDEE